MLLSGHQRRQDEEEMLKCPQSNDAIKSYLQNFVKGGPETMR